MRVFKYCYWGAMPWEMDGGAVVNYYLLNQMNKQRPKDQYWVVPKVPHEYDASAMPFANPVFTDDNQPEIVLSAMIANEIPILNLFHVGRTELLKILQPVHEIGSQIVLHQTVHWDDDDIFKMKDRLGEFDKIVTPTNWAKTQMVSVAKLSPRKIHVIPHGVPINKYYQHRSYLKAELGIKPDQKVFLYTGRLSTWKGVVEIMKMMRHLINDFNAVFIFRGGAFKGLDVSEKIDYVLTTISARNPHNVIYLHDWQPPSFMEELFNIADFGLFTSGHEGFGVPLIENMACKNPFVATALPNMQEIGGQNTLTGLFLSPNKVVGEVNEGTEIRVPSADSIYGACKWLLENPDEAQLMGERGRRRVEKIYNLKKVAKMWFKLYDGMFPDGYDFATELGEKLYQ